MYVFYFFFSTISNESHTRMLSICGQFVLEIKKKKIDNRKSHFCSAFVRLLEGADCEKEAKNLTIYKK